MVALDYYCCFCSGNSFKLVFLTKTRESGLSERKKIDGSQTFAVDLELII